MDNKKLKKVFFLCLFILLILIIVTSCNVSEMMNNEEPIQPSNVNVESVHNFEKFDYNNLSNSQKDYIRKMYLNNVRFTERGVEVYNDNTFSSKMIKVITSSWPKDDIGRYIPVIEFGSIDRIEYSDLWIEIFVEDVKKGEIKDYLKELEKYGFINEAMKEDDGDISYYKIYDDKENYVQLIYNKDINKLEIYAEIIKY